jgi:hypothetical protein
MPIGSYAQSFDYLENAVYVYNFIKNTQWPQFKTHLEIGIIGKTPLETNLKYLLSKKNSSAVTYSVKNIPSDEAKTMDVVIVAESMSQQLKSISKQTASSPILIISEKENMGSQGACISFFIDEDNDFKTSYQLSIRNYRQRGLSPGKQILNNAVLTR